MKTNHFFVLIFGFILILLSSCSKVEQQGGYYKITKSEIEILSPNSVDSLDADIFKEKCKIYFTDSYVKIYSKDTITVLTEYGDFTYGKFKYESKDKLDINLFDIGNFKFSVREENDDQGELEYLVLTGIANEKFSVKLLFKKDESLKSSKRDLMSFAANSWRIKPQKAETDVEIKKRVKAQLSYMVSYFSFIDEEDRKSFKIGHLRSPFEFYSNGIAIKEINLSDYFKNFYNEEDAMKGLKLLISGLNSISVYPSDKNSYTKGYTNVINEILRFLNVS